MGTDHQSVRRASRLMMMAVIKKQVREFGTANCYAA